MARNIKEILEEMFKGRDAAVEKYAKVRMTQYEMNLWHLNGLPLSEVDGSAKQYFAKRFLGGQRIASASSDEINKAFERLGHAVDDGCHGRCKKLVEEMNEALKELGLSEIQEIDKFLHWLTFDYTMVKDHDGNPVREPGYGFGIRIFHCDENRKAIWNELQLLLKEGRMMSMQDVARITIHKQKHSKRLGS